MKSCYICGAPNKFGLKLSSSSSAPRYCKRVCDQIYFTSQQSLPLTIITMWWCNKSQSTGWVPIFQLSPWSAVSLLSLDPDYLSFCFLIACILLIFPRHCLFGHFYSLHSIFTHCRWDRTWTPSPGRKTTANRDQQASKQTKIATNKKPEVEGTLSSWQGTQSGRLGFLCCTLSDPAIDLIIVRISIAVIIAQVKQCFRK